MAFNPEPYNNIPVSLLLSYLKMFVRVCSQMSLRAGVEGMLYHVVVLNFVRNFEFGMNWGQDWLNLV